MHLALFLRTDMYEVVFLRDDTCLISRESNIRTRLPSFFCACKSENHNNKVTLEKKQGLIINEQIKLLLQHLCCLPVSIFSHVLVLHILRIFSLKFPYYDHISFWSYIYHGTMVRSFFFFNSFFFLHFLSYFHKYKVYSRYSILSFFSNFHLCSTKPTVLCFYKPFYLT